jgi:hypothetical protein
MEKLFGTHKARRLDTKTGRVSFFPRGCRTLQQYSVSILGGQCTKQLDRVVLVILSPLCLSVYVPIYLRRLKEARSFEILESSVS